MRIEELKIQHLQYIDVQDAQKHLVDNLYNEDYCKYLVENTESYALVNDDNKVIFAGGIIRQVEGRGLMWSIFAKDSGKYFVRIVRAIRHILPLFKEYHRIELTVAPDFCQAHRFAKVIGFEKEATLKKYFSNGEDADLYVRFRV